MVEKLKSLPAQVSATGIHSRRVSASFHGYSYVYFEVIKTSSNGTSFSYRIVSGRLEDIIVEQLPQNAASFRTQPTAQFRIWSDGSAGAWYIKDDRELWEMNASVLEYYTKAPGYSSDVGPYDLGIEDITERVRVIRAFQHLGKLCAAIKADEKKASKFFPPPGEPF